MEWKGYEPPNKGQPKYPYATMKELCEHAEDSKLSIAQVMMANEVAVSGKTEEQINAFLDKISGAMVALVLGRLGRTGPLSWHIPFAASLTLRNFGLTLLLAAVGLGAGAPIVAIVAQTGFTFLAMGAAIVLGAILGVMLLGHALFKMSTDDLFGVVSGATGNPAILVYANRALPSGRVDVAFATIVPSMTILKIVCAQVAIGVFGRWRRKRKGPPLSRGPLRAVPAGGAGARSCRSYWQSSPMPSLFVSS